MLGDGHTSPTHGSPRRNMGLRILLAEDHEDLREVVKLLLEGRPDWKVCGEAVDGMEAVKKADELKPDLIIMDLLMPKMDGLRASELVSAMAPHTPILLYTNYSLSPHAILEAKKAGAWEVLSKGAQPEEFLNTVEALHAHAVTKAMDQAGQA